MSGVLRIDSLYHIFGNFRGPDVLRVPNAILIALCIAVFDILPVLGTGGIMIPWGIISLIMGKWVLGLDSWHCT